MRFSSTSYNPKSRKCDLAVDDIHEDITENSDSCVPSESGFYSKSIVID